MRHCSGLVAGLGLLFVLGLGAVIVGTAGEVIIGAALSGGISHVYCYGECAHVDGVAVWDRGQCYCRRFHRFPWLRLFMLVRDRHVHVKPEAGFSLVSQCWVGPRLYGVCE